jgi:hypothetical protein
MKLPRFNSSDIFPGGYSITTGFGWDIGPSERAKIDPGGDTWPRIHPATDYASSGLIYSPMDFAWTQWIPKDSLGCSILRLLDCPIEKGFAFELRMVHINENEMVKKKTLPELHEMRSMKKGTPIAPTGNTGSSFGLNGGRHLHCFPIIRPGIFEDELDERFGDLWREDHAEEMASAYGQRFLDEMTKRGISKINPFALWKQDPYWKREIIVLNIQKIFD